jgi:prepilin-type N-terminal cleavage/methylation domain-containing protein
MDSKTPEQGFTLIEIVVTILISLVITSGLVINYNDFNSTQVLKQAALTLKNDLRFLQSKAANGEKPSPCVSLTGWTITFASASYSYQANCDGSLVGNKTDILFSPAISLSPIPVPNSVTFNVLTRGTDLPAPVSVILNTRNKRYTLQISPSGDISDIGIQ